MKGTNIEERVACLGLGPEEVGLLYALRPRLEERAKEIEVAMFRAVESVPQLFVHAEQPGIRDILERTHRDYLLSFSKRRFGAEFEAARHAIGEHFQRTGVEPQWVIRGFVIYFSLLVPEVSHVYLGEPAKIAQAVAALGRRVALDVEIILEGYIGRRQQEFSFTTDALAREGRQLQRDLSARAVELREAREQARMAGELASVGTLAAGLAHEIGTPMSVIQGHAKMLQADPTDGAWRLQTILDQIGRISRIMRTLLRIARPRRMEHRSVELASLIEETLEFVGDRLRRQAVQVKLDLTPDLGAVRADAERLQQLFLNLFLNAADAMPDGGELSVDLWRVEHGVCVRVTDTGTGIAAEHLPRVFEPFFTTKEAGHGNGLGLMVCKGIAADHGGSIEVASEPGVGSTFTIRLPATPPVVPDGTTA